MVKSEMRKDQQTLKNPTVGHVLPPLALLQEAPQTGYCGTHSIDKKSVVSGVKMTHSPLPSQQVRGLASSLRSEAPSLLRNGKREDPGVHVLSLS